MSSNRNSGLFSFLYRTRVKVHKDSICLVNLSILFCLLAVGSAPWLVVAGGIIALALGYRFSMERNAPEFCGNWNEVVQDAAQNVKNAVDSLSGKEQNP